MTRTTIMLSQDLKQRAMAEVRKLKISFADFVRQAVSEKLPRGGREMDRLKQRGQDPLFRLLDRLTLVRDGTATDIAVHHDDYLYEEQLDPTRK